MSKMIKVTSGQKWSKILFIYYIDIIDVFGISQNKSRSLRIMSSLIINTLYS